MFGLKYYEPIFQRNEPNHDLVDPTVKSRMWRFARFTPFLALLSFMMIGFVLY